MVPARRAPHPSSSVSSRLEVGMANGGPPQRLDIASALSPTVAAARLGFAIILVATFVWGIWISSEADGLGDWPTRAGSARLLVLSEALLIASRPMPAVWDFLSVTATPIGFAFLLLVRAEALRPTVRARAIANAGLQQRSRWPWLAWEPGFGQWWLPSPDRCGVRSQSRRSRWFWGSRCSCQRPRYAMENRRGASCLTPSRAP